MKNVNNKVRNEEKNTSTMEYDILSEASLTSMDEDLNEVDVSVEDMVRVMGACKHRLFC